MNEPARGPLFLLLVAIQFLTRIPVSRDLNPTPREFGACAPYFPAVGLIVGGILGGVAWTLLALPIAPGIAAMIVLIAGVFVTGAFHEDGLADTADGIGGGWTKEDKLRIMRDSRVGSYGAIAIAFLLLRVAALWAMEPGAWLSALPLAHVLSRWSILPLMKILPYARADAPGLGKPIVERISWRGLAVSTAGVAAFCVVSQRGVGLACLPVVAVVSWLLGRFFRRQLGGLTGDALGAANVVCEVFVLIACAVAHPAVASPWIVR